MTQSGLMATRTAILIALGCASLPLLQSGLQSGLWGQTASDDEPIAVSTEHPRLLLRPSRLRLLRRERERKSLRWQQFELYMAGHAAMPEPGFAKALYYQVAGDSAAGREAIAAVLGPATDLRQEEIGRASCRERV